MADDPIPENERLFYLAGHAGQRRAISSRPLPARKLDSDGRNYIADARLVRAVNVALLLGQPLLVTGEPGVGKSDLALSIMDDLKLPRSALIRHTITSDATRQQILYDFDELGRLRNAYAAMGNSLRDAMIGSAMLGSAPARTPPPASTESQSGASPPPPPPPVLMAASITPADPLTAYFEFVGLGRAILMAGGGEAELERLTTRGRGQGSLPELTRFAHLADGLSPQGEQVVLLLDEIDKAPRDLPNDLLHELEHMEFSIPPLGVRVSLPPDRPRPIIIITSNSERSLPEAFLRRCAFVHIAFPDDDRLRVIIGRRLAELRLADALITEALQLVALLRAEGVLEKRPSTAEVLSWLRVLAADGQVPTSLRRMAEPVLRASLGALAKDAGDMERATKVLTQWLAPTATR
jgi:MoxR-like ATPase